MYLKPRTQILYVPFHAFDNENHSDVEEGFVTSHAPNADTVFCRYWSKSSPDELRTKANSEATPLSSIRKKDTRNQSDVDSMLKSIAILQ